MPETCRPLTAADIKKTIREGASKVYVGAVDDKLWLSDSYWLAPITHHLSTFCETYGISTAEPGTWTIDAAKTAHSSAQAPPNFAGVLPAGWDKVGTGARLPKTDKPWHELVPCVTDHTGNALVFVQVDNPALVLSSEDGSLVTGASVAYLRVIGGGWDLATTAHYDDGRLTFAVDADYCRVRIFAFDTLKPVVAILEHSDEPGKPWVEDFRAVLMPVRL